MLRPRLIALQTEAQNHPSLRKIDQMLLELSYMPRNPETVALADDLLDQRQALAMAEAVA